MWRPPHPSLPRLVVHADWGSVAEKFGRLDIAVNNAGLGILGQ